MSGSSKAVPFTVALSVVCPGGSAAVAGFAMGVGYLFGTLGPLLGGWLFSTTDGWIVPRWVYVATFIPMAIGGIVMARPGRYIEDVLDTDRG